MNNLLKTCVLCGSFTLLSASTLADTFSLKSADISQGEFMSKAQEFQGFGCSGDNLSPQLSWTDAPEGTKAFAVIAFDPDAPTGSGWWHWQLVNIPADTTMLPTGAGSADNSLIPKGSVQISNDYGTAAFGGACPSEGHGVHRYQFTIHALSKKLDLPNGPSGALVGYLINAHSLASSTIESLYER
ncbi:YbhB/YbcL family Raf kinase inhibitor-like protein [Alteromonas sp. 5E99-2]|uniref:YbhB/YbcL family Raf kinase inhibitor-like protein n=1 Tax=Alteromonas sp. 5E99-2 TaxID=2817683 RepID=UPI001A98A1E2|nr:YbhB/YbcL family Raf kinase inhibitor-like protein [Alteromonas sp. 5E99-2]MBO1255543.1 YbhB/YbcL family Raf kinase inhibitor-like protein [Alteromonas sp. 5E99-2]